MTIFQKLNDLERFVKQGFAFVKGLTTGFEQRIVALENTVGSDNSVPLTVATEIGVGNYADGQFVAQLQAEGVLPVEDGVYTIRNESGKVFGILLGTDIDATVFGDADRLSITLATEQGIQSVTVAIQAVESFTEMFNKASGGTGLEPTGEFADFWMAS
jgi:hypothetical protein